MRDPLIDLAARVTKSERTYTRMAEQSWRDGDVISAMRWRYIAEGLAMARDHHADVIAERKATTTTTEGATTA